MTLYACTACDFESDTATGCILHIFEEHPHDLTATWQIRSSDDAGRHARARAQMADARRRRIRTFAQRYEPRDA